MITLADEFQGYNSLLGTTFLMRTYHENTSHYRKNNIRYCTTRYNDRDLNTGEEGITRAARSSSSFCLGGLLEELLLVRETGKSICIREYSTLPK